MKKIFVLGVGPGSPDYILPIVREKAAECRTLAGGSRNLDLFAELGRKEILLTARLQEALEKIAAAREEGRVGILVTGDPGFYSFLNVLSNYFHKGELEVYPGVSSLQVLFARGVLPWQDAYMTSLHGRRSEELGQIVRTHGKVAFLTDPSFPAGEVARTLIELGVKGKRALVGEDLCYPQEKITDMSLEEWSGRQVSDLAVMVIYDG